MTKLKNIRNVFLEVLTCVREIHFWDEKFFEMSSYTWEKSQNGIPSILNSVIWFQTPFLTVCSQYKTKKQENQIFDMRSSLG